MNLQNHNCPLCGGGSFASIFERAGVPVMQNTLYRSAAEAKAAPRGDIALVFCNHCGFVRNAAFDAGRISYETNYENDQSYSPGFLAHMDALADRILAVLPATGGTVLEIGCGQGRFLTLLSARGKARRLNLHGLDPAFRNEALPEGISILAKSLDDHTIAESQIVPDVLILRHVIEHIPDPVGFLTLIQRLTHKGSNTRLFVETPCFAWIAANKVVQDVFYEHVNYFTAETLSDAIAAAGFSTRSVEHVFGGQYLLVEAIASEPIDIRRRDVTSAINAAVAYGQGVRSEITRWQVMLSDETRTALWGAGAKGATFAGLVDADRSRLTCLIDINPKKQGAWIAGTTHPIVSPDEAARRGVKRILTMNPNYVDEIRATVAARGWNMTVVIVGQTQ